MLSLRGIPRHHFLGKDAPGIPIDPLHGIEAKQDISRDGKNSMLGEKESCGMPGDAVTLMLQCATI